VQRRRGEAKYIGVRRWKSGGGGGLKDNENDFFPRERKKVLDYPGWWRGWWLSGGEADSGCWRRVCYVYIRRRRVVRAWRVRACKTVLYAGHNNSPRFGSRSKGGAVAGIMVGGGRLCTAGERRGLWGDVRGESRRLEEYIAVSIRI